MVFVARGLPSEISGCDRIRKRREGCLGAWEVGKPCGDFVVTKLIGEDQSGLGPHGDKRLVPLCPFVGPSRLLPGALDDGRGGWWLEHARDVGQDHRAQYGGEIDNCGRFVEDAGEFFLAVGCLTRADKQCVIMKCLEKIADAAFKSVQLKEWCAQREAELDAGEVAAVITALNGLTLREKTKKQMRDKAVRYFRNNASHTRFAESRAKGLFVGSAVVDAGCRTVVGARIKQSGMQWTVKAGQNIVTLLCLMLSASWESSTAA